ncbi:MAG: DUF1080 domain-containing protein [Algoriphagus sp.]|uniref:3-keto-disaccharide hydrolase n=1 Tax=Algoriphagus sp. TaxID=1872435 RepID=UPI002731BD91|nr:DUF1080 domain-containing protein [Algoriphagus sp.]MDP2041994.1 DUF1080 domain-containing protein [Algoriphagus sp.]MDP3473397.1 DUF1080 domain-containing protein [Algoriphagus sp.]
MKNCTSLHIFLIICFCLTGCQVQTISTNKKKTVILFNGKNLDNWYTFVQHRGRDSDPKNVFTVQDGMIRISGEEWGCITTNNEFENYRLVAEFKWGEKTFEPRVKNARDSGILLHSVGEDGGSEGIWMYSIECQLIEGGTGDFIVVGDGSENFSITSPVAEEKLGNSPVFQAGGKETTVNRGRVNWYGRDPDWKDVIDFRGNQDVENPVGEWNRVECLVEGDKISIFLNGKLVNQASNVRPSRGKIQIQSEGAEIFFRKVELELLPQN